jgi:enoyl-CoA hydratase
MRGEVGVLRLAHGKANALDRELCEALIVRLEACRAAPLTSLVITGSGPMFSAGVDLPRVVEGGASYVRAFLPVLSRALEALFTFPRPVVSAVNGHAIAGGCIIACAADDRLMAIGPGRIGVPELVVGVPFPIVPLEIMRFAAPQFLQALAYRGATLSAEAAVQHGLVDEAVESEALVDRAVAAANRLGALPSEVFAMTKAQLRAPALQRMREGASYDATVAGMWESHETMDRIRSYIVRTFKKT